MVPLGHIEFTDSLLVIIISKQINSGLIPGLRPANERRRYFVMNDVSHWLGTNLESAL